MRCSHLSSLLVLVSLCPATLGQTAVKIGPRHEERPRGRSFWVDWSDDTEDRLVADPTVGIDDPWEKDMFAADFDKDGDTDIVIARKFSFTVPGGKPNVLLMNENGILVDRTAQYVPSFATPDDTRDIVAFDADGDTWLDLVTATTWGEQPRFWTNLGEDMNGDWLGFQEVPNWFTPIFSPTPNFCAVNFGDVDGDLDMDLFFSDYDNDLEDRLLINDGTGFFTDETSTRLNATTSESGFGTGNFIHDFNLDGHNDIIKGEAAIIKLLWNDGNGNFFDQQEIPAPGAYMIRTCDLNNDARMDFYVVDDGLDYFYLNKLTTAGGNIQTQKITIFDADQTESLGGNIDCWDVDQDGYLDVGVCDVDTSNATCFRKFAILRNVTPDQTNPYLLDPNDPGTLPWNTSGTYDFVFIDIDQDGFKDIFLGTCSGNRIMMGIPFQLPGLPFCASRPNSTGGQREDPGQRLGEHRGERLPPVRLGSRRRSAGVLLLWPPADDGAPW